MAVSKVHLDTLPIELQIKILKLLSDVSILYSLVHASPAYHSVYAANREVILTNVTFNELQGRSIDILEPTSFAQVRVWKDKFSLFLQPAIVA